MPQKALFIHSALATVSERHVHAPYTGKCSNFDALNELNLNYFSLCAISVYFFSVTIAFGLLALRHFLLSAMTSINIAHVQWNGREVGLLNNIVSTRKISEQVVSEAVGGGGCNKTGLVGLVASLRVLTMAPQNLRKSCFLLDGINVRCGGA